VNADKLWKKIGDFKIYNARLQGFVGFFDGIGVKVNCVILLFTT
jgi:hypothetical protein